MGVFNLGRNLYQLICCANFCVLHLAAQILQCLADADVGGVASLHRGIDLHERFADLLASEPGSFLFSVWQTETLMQQSFHIIRSEEACMESSCLAASLARQTGARLHIAHISTEAELNAIFSPTLSDDLPQITAEATVAHLMFDNNDYRTLGARIKCNPAIKKPSDKEALRKGLMNGQISTIGTDHAPHCIEEKQGGAAKAMSALARSVPMRNTGCSSHSGACAAFR